MNKHSPATVEVTRGNVVESIHLADVVVCDSGGKIVHQCGDADRIVFPRSSAKAFQAVPLVESGAADAFGFENKHISLACSSHGGQPIHITAVEEMLSKSDLASHHLECGCNVPRSIVATEELYRAGGNASEIFNTCSGKHAGMLAFARHTGLETRGYIAREHRVQQEVLAVLEAFSGVPHGVDVCGVDGCSIPTHAIPLKATATAAARFVTADGLEEKRKAATTRIWQACCDYPEMVAGEGFACTRIMRATGRNAFVKFGAEGVYLAMLPTLGLGAVIKARDGAERAVDSLMAELIIKMLDLGDPATEQLNRIARPAVTNRNGTEVGVIRPKLW